MRDFDGGTFHLATVDEWPISKTMSGGLMVIKPGQMRKLHWNPNANEWHFYLKGKGQVALFGSGGRGKVAEFKPGDVGLHPAGLRPRDHEHRRRGPRDRPDLGQRQVRGDRPRRTGSRRSPNYLLANNFAGVPAETIAKLKQS